MLSLRDYHYVSYFFKIQGNFQLPANRFHNKFLWRCTEPKLTQEQLTWITLSLLLILICNVRRKFQAQVGFTVKFHLTLTEVVMTIWYPVLQKTAEEAINTFPLSLLGQHGLYKPKPERHDRQNSGRDYHLSVI